MNTDAYSEGNGSAKRFLIPLIALLICAVSLTGAAYAYNAQLEGDSPDIPVGDVVIHFGDKTGETVDKFVFITGSATDFAYKSKTVLSGSTYTTTYGLDASPVGDYVFKFKVHSVNGEAFTIDTANSSAEVKQSDATDDRFDCTIETESSDPADVQTVIVKISCEADAERDYIDADAYAALAFKLTVTIKATAANASDA